MTKTFKEVVAGIRTAIYGREVREDIAQGMEYVEGFASTAVSKASEASTSASSASQSAASAASSQSAAAASESSASTSAASAQTSATNAAASATEAQKSAEDAAASAELAGERAGTDKTLTIADAPADAKQVGDELELRYTKEQVDTLLTQYKADCLLAAHPVGSLYMSDEPTSPAELFGGTWEQIADGRALMGADTVHPAGSTAEAGLPNITGRVAFSSTSGDSFTPVAYASGAFFKSSEGNGRVSAESSNIRDNIIAGFDASLSSAIYGNSSTVQPSAYFSNIWKRIE